ncbi:hypothetical protein Bca4012_008693 [Brassica carinata]
MTEEEIIVTVDRTAERVLDGQNSAVRDTEFHRLKRIFKLGARDSLAVWVSLTCGCLRVSACNALIRNT